MCLQHWKMVPKSIQDQVYEFYEPGQCDGDPRPSKAWLEAAHEAIKAVREMEEGPV
jgi:hypothetical protein